MTDHPPSTTRSAVMRDILGVGPRKPLGYLPLSTIVARGHDPEQVRRFVERRGLRGFMFDAHETDIGSGALFVAHLASLQALIYQHLDVVVAVWPKTILAEDFVVRVATVQVNETCESQLYHLIGLAFADRRFIGKPIPKVPP